MQSRGDPRSETGSRPAVLLKACLNGGRRPDEHPAVPVRPEQLAAEAKACVRAGAAALHVHPRRADGLETLHDGDCGAALRAIRTACPGVPLGLSTGLWIEGDAARRLSAIAGWTVLPDFVSVNFSEPGTEAVCALLHERGIGIEAGLWSVGDARAFAAGGFAGRCLRILLEPREADVAQAVATADGICAVLDARGIRTRRLLHGEGAPAWGVLEAALARGYDARIGFEDTLELPDGRPASSNAALVAAAAERVHRHGAVLARPTPAHR